MDPPFDDPFDSPRYPLSFMLQDALLTPVFLILIGSLFLR
jgi:hypothetical protein